MSSPRLLEGIKVLDLTHVLAGPYCSGLLATMGADVIKVEQPSGGDLLRTLGPDAALNERKMGVHYLSVNAGKRCIAVNFKSAEGAEIIRALACRSDVVIESFRAGALDALDLGHESLMALNSRLIYCAISGFGQDGPMRGVRAYDHVMQAMSGLMSLTGEPDGASMKVGLPVTDNATGLCALFGITSALFARERTGRGAFIDCSMLESAYSLMASHVTETLMTGTPPPRVGNSAFTGSPSSDSFATGEGELLIGANTEAMCTKLLGELGLGRLSGDTRFSTRDSRIENRVAFHAAIEGVLKNKSAVQWEKQLREAGLPCSVVRDLDASLAIEQNRARDVYRSMPLDTTHKDAPILGAPFKVDGERAHPKNPPRTLGSDTREVLAELGYSEAKISALLETGAAQQL